MDTPKAHAARSDSLVRVSLSAVWVHRELILCCMASLTAGVAFWALTATSNANTPNAQVLVAPPILDIDRSGGELWVPLDNRSRHDLSIRAVIPSCGCTRISAVPETVPALSQREFKVELANNRPVSSLNESLMILWQTEQSQATHRTVVKLRAGAR